MPPTRRRLAVAFAAVMTVAVAMAFVPAQAATKTPRWILHIQNYSGGISNGVRERLAFELGQTTARHAVRSAMPSLGTLENVQMNGDTDPPLPQDEPGIALNLENHMNAVAASNDYTGDGFWIGYTTDGGRHWASQWKDPKFSFDPNHRCFASDPGVAYSIRDHAFYMSTLCYFVDTPASEIHVWKSVDGGATWSDSTHPALVVTNRASDGTIDASVFNDKELIAVDNTPSSPHYGRVYVTYTKFHTVAGGRSDYCTIQAAHTDSIPTADPATSVWAHTAVVPDNPGDDGKGASANQFSTPVVDGQGGLDIGFVSEDCNTSYDRALLFARSTDGGASFGDVVRVDRPGEWVDNPNRNDYLQGLGGVRIPGTIGFAYDATRSRLVYVALNAIDRETSGTNISAHTSNDFGATWSSATWVSVGDPGVPAAGNQFFPAVGVDEDGVYSAIWQDTRSDRHLIETFQGTSTDGGATWTNTLISTAAFDPGDSFFSCGCFIGDYNQIAVSRDVIYPAWTDGRDSPGRPSGDSDIFTNVEIAT
jgi:hypothetical protein